MGCIGTSCVITDFEVTIDSIVSNCSPRKCGDDVDENDVIDKIVEKLKADAAAPKCGDGCKCIPIDGAKPSTITQQMYFLIKTTKYCDDGTECRCYSSVEATVKTISTPGLCGLDQAAAVQTGAVGIAEPVALKGAVLDWGPIALHGHAHLSKRS